MLLLTSGYIRTKSYVQHLNQLTTKRYNFPAWNKNTSKKEKERQTLSSGLSVREAVMLNRSTEVGGGEKSLATGRCRGHGTLDEGLLLTRILLGEQRMKSKQWVSFLLLLFSFFTWLVHFFFFSQRLSFVWFSAAQSMWGFSGLPWEERGEVELMVWTEMPLQSFFMLQSQREKPLKVGGENANQFLFIQCKITTKSSLAVLHKLSDSCKKETVDNPASIFETGNFHSNKFQLLLYVKTKIIFLSFCSYFPLRKLSCFLSSFSKLLFSAGLSITYSVQLFTHWFQNGTLDCNCK